MKSTEKRLILQQTPFFSALLSRQTGRILRELDLHVNLIYATQSF